MAAVAPVVNEPYTTYDQFTNDQGLREIIQKVVNGEEYTYEDVLRIRTSELVMRSSRFCNYTKVDFSITTEH